MKRKSDESLQEMVVHGVCYEKSVQQLLLNLASHEKNVLHEGIGLELVHRSPFVFYATNFPSEREANEAVVRTKHTCCHGSSVFRRVSTSDTLLTHVQCQSCRASGRERYRTKHHC